MRRGLSPLSITEEHSGMAPELAKISAAKDKWIYYNSTKKKKAGQLQTAYSFLPVRVIDTLFSLEPTTEAGTGFMWHISTHAAGHSLEISHMPSLTYPCS